MKDKIIAILEAVRPTLQADGGDVEFVDFNKDEGVLKVRLTGACSGCPLAAITLKENVERYLKSEIKEIKEVIAI